MTSEMAMADSPKSFAHALFSRFGSPPAPPGPYHAYTTAFDVVTSALDLDTAIGRLDAKSSALVEEASQVLEMGLHPWKVRLHLLAAETSGRIRDALTREERDATVVSLLFDQSGSMKGQKALFAAASADVCQEFLRTLGIRVEVLGFTTVRWRGGRSRIQWINHRRPRDPGRLNDLLHIIYRDASDDRVSAGGPAFHQMLRPDLLKENIDGEALEWAASRLLARPESRKLLIVVSDGAPVDDATLIANGPNYLSDHWQKVIGALEVVDDIVLGAVGLGFDVSEIYARSAFVEAPDELGSILISFVEKMLVQAWAIGDDRP